MNIDELRGLAGRAEGVEGRQADRLNEVHARIRTARRRRAAVGASAAVAVVIALVVAGAALTGTAERTQDPVDRRTPRPTPTERVEVPAGQTTVRPDIGPGDIGGWELKASRANSEPAFANAADLSLTVEMPGFLDTGGVSRLASFCHGEPDTWWVLTVGPGSVADGMRGMYGRCSQNDPTTVPPPTGPIDPGRRDEGTAALPVRMFVTGPLPAAAQRCLGTKALATNVGCPASLGLVPLAETDATFGFGVYEPRRAPTVLDIPGLARLEAVGIAGGVEYLVDRAVLPAEGASRLVVRLPASDRRRMIGLVRGGDTPALEDCVARLGHGEPSDANEEMAQYEEVDRTCLTDLELRVDGERPPKQDDSDSSFAEVALPPGAAHVVTVEVVRNDPRNVRYALVIWEERR